MDGKKQILYKKSNIIIYYACIYAKQYTDCTRFAAWLNSLAQIQLDIDASKLLSVLVSRSCFT